MRRTASRFTPLLAGAALALAPGHAGAQAEPGTRIVSSEIAVSRDAAELRVELEDGRLLDLRLTADRAVRVGRDRVGSYQRRDALDQAWRDLLQQAMDAPTAELPALLAGWDPPAAAGEAGRRLSRELSSALGAAATQPAPAADMADSIRRLNERIREMERLLEDPEALDRLDRDALADLPAIVELRRTLESDLRREIRQELRAETRQRARPAPLRHVTRGLAGVVSTVLAFAVLVGLGFLAVFFGRPYLEGIADTARRSTLRSGLVGLAGSFLVLPAFILGILALAISIVGIPFLLVYLPLFPVALVVAALAGYLAVAHGAGEALAERRFSGDEFYSRANSYYYVLTGVALLVSLFLVGHVVSMAGPWLGFLRGLLQFMAIMVTWAAFTVGFGAVLISRGGTRPIAEPGPLPEEERIHV